MKLYYMPGACSLSPHIVACELGLDIKLVKVDRDKKTEEGEDFLKLNPKGYVPALQLDNGHMLTEGVAIVQYLADQKPGGGLIPKAGTEERYVAQEWLTFISSEVHKAFSPLFNPKITDDWKAAATANVTKRLAFTGQVLRDKDYLMGSHVSVADAYLFTILRWAQAKKFDLSELKLDAYFGRMAARPGVQAALKAEGLS